MPTGVYKRTSFHRLKISEGAKLHGNGKWMLGRKVPRKSVEKMLRHPNHAKSLFKKGHSVPEEWTQKTIEVNKTLLGKKANAWKGDEVLYMTKHNWFYRRFGKASRCDNEDCEGKSKRFDWANLDHKYRRDLKDWAQLCRKCHSRYDHKLMKLNLKHTYEI